MRPSEGRVIARAPRPFDVSFHGGWARCPETVMLSAIGQGDELAYRELFRRHAPAVAVTVRTILGRARFEEVVDDVFLAMWIAPEDFDPSRGSLVGYLRLKATHRSIDVLRSEASRARREQRHGRDETATAGVEASLLQADMVDGLHRAIDTLPPTERTAIRLAFFGDMTYAAVASHLDVAEGTVKSRIRSALRHLAASDDVRAHADQLVRR